MKETNRSSISIPVEKLSSFLNPVYSFSREDYYFWRLDDEVKYIFSK